MLLLRCFLQISQIPHLEQLVALDNMNVFDSSQLEHSFVWAPLAFCPPLSVACVLCSHLQTSHFPISLRICFQESPGSDTRQAGSVSKKVQAQTQTRPTPPSGPRGHPYTDHDKKAQWSGSWAVAWTAWAHIPTELL